MHHKVMRTSYLPVPVLSTYLSSFLHNTLLYDASYLCVCYRNQAHYMYTYVKGDQLI